MNRLTIPLRQTAAVLCTAALALVAACGGGGSSTPTTGTPSVTATNYSQGPIAGFGSVIVNGVRWDDSSASVTDDDGVSHSSSELKLGMVVEVDGSSVDRSAATGTGKAMAIRFGSETVGPIASVDAATSTFKVLGINVEVTTTTVFDSSIVGGFAGLTADAVVEIHGLFDAANNKIVATRIEPKTGATEFRMRGVVSALDTTAKTFMLGTETVSYASLAALPSWVADGVQAKVRLQTTKDAAGAWVATKLRPIGTSISDRSEAEVEGAITVFTSVTSFEINGMKVDASGATLPADTSGIVLGAHVEVKGAIKDGVLVATSVKVDDDSHHGSGGDGGGTMREVELHGAISGLNADTKTFTLRGLTVNYGGSAVVFKDGTIANLANDAKVEVKGVVAADGVSIDATRIDFDH